MRTARLAGAFLLALPRVSAHLLVEAALLRSVARGRAGAGARPWGERVEAIGAEWVAELLRSGGALGPADVVSALTIERIGEEGQMSAVYRLRPTYEGAAGPRELIVKATAATVKNRLLNTVLGVFREEIRAYRLPAPERGLLRPRCWYAGQQPVTGASLLILDDLREWRYPGYDNVLSRDDAGRVVEALAVHQARWWCDPGLRDRGFTTTARVYRDTLIPMVRLAWRRSRGRLRGLVEPALVDLLGRFVGRMDAVIERLSAGPSTLLHGDLNLNNLFFDDAAGRVCAIDWQAARIGSWSEDLAYALVMNMDAEACAAHEEALLGVHRRALAAAGVELDARAHREGYAWGLFQVAAILLIASLILDPKKDPPLYASYQRTIRAWAAAARRNRLSALLAEIGG